MWIHFSINPSDLYLSSGPITTVDTTLHRLQTIGSITLDSAVNSPEHSTAWYGLCPPRPPKMPKPPERTNTKFRAGCRKPDEVCERCTQTRLDVLAGPVWYRDMNSQVHDFLQTPGACPVRSSPVQAQASEA